MQQVIRALTNTLESKRGRWLLFPHAVAESECPVQGRIDDKLITGTVDRLFRDEQDKLWIVDYKTSEHQGGSLQAFLNREVDRYRQQMESYGALLSRMMPGPIWLGLYFPLLDAWRNGRLRKPPFRPKAKTLLLNW